MESTLASLRVNQRMSLVYLKESERDTREQKTKDTSTGVKMRERFLHCALLWQLMFEDGWLWTEWLRVTLIFHGFGISASNRWVHFLV